MTGNWTVGVGVKGGVGIEPLTSLNEICRAGTVNGVRKNEHAPGNVIAGRESVKSSRPLSPAPLASPRKPVRIVGSWHGGGVGVRVGVRVGVLVSVGVLLGVTVNVRVGVCVRVGVLLTEMKVFVGVGVLVAVGGVPVTVGVEVGVEVPVGCVPVGVGVQAGIVIATGCA
jgi:hypothetical protein